jgi:hypothetical protein
MTGLLLAGTLCACGNGAMSPQSVADATTKAVYDDDVNAVQTHFDQSLQKTVTLDGVASLSQKLHAVGAYTGLSQTAADASSGRYDYLAQFGNTALAVHLRVDPDGHIAAYRIDVPQSLSART